MKPRLQFSVPCLNIPEDESRPPSFEHIFYELPFPKFPFQVDFFLANGWTHGQGRFAQAVKLLDPDKAVLVETEAQTFELEKVTVPFMVINKFEGVQFARPGVYWFQILLDGQLALEYPLEIRQVQTS